MSQQLTPLLHFWQPRYWLQWMGVGLLRLIVLLPQSARMACGRFLGRRMHSLLNERRRVALRNLEICFPEMSDEKRRQLAKRHFESLGMGVIELGMAWWCSDAEVNRLTKGVGTENLINALEQGRGVILLSAHFSSSEFTGRRLQQLVPPLSAMYRPSNNPLTDQIMRRVRSRTIAELISKNSIRSLLRALGNNLVVWYAADQAYSRQGTALAMFFGEPATTNTATSQIARVSGAAVVPYFPIRIDNGRSYQYDILAPLENFPSNDPQADAERLNRLLEQRILAAPEQYYWVHRRFKNRRDGMPDPY